MYMIDLMGIQEATHGHHFISRSRLCSNRSLTCQAVRLRRLISDLESKNKKEPTPISCDNNSDIALSKNHVFTTEVNTLIPYITSFMILSKMGIHLFNFVDPEIS